MIDCEIENNNFFSWINPKLSLRESSVNGIGYFANELIERNEKIIVQCGQCLHVSEIDNAAMEPYWYYGFQIESDIYYYPFFTGDKPHLDGIFRINHSCEPNAGFNGQITLVALRDIQSGEEISYDYAMTDIETAKEDPWTPEECYCRSHNCRKVMTGSDWKLAELQRKYDGYFSTHVARSIAEDNQDPAL